MPKQVVVRYLDDKQVMNMQITLFYCDDDNDNLKFKLTLYFYTVGIKILLTHHECY